MIIVNIVFEYKYPGQGTNSFLNYKISQRVILNKKSIVLKYIDVTFQDVFGKILLNLQKYEVL